MVGPVQSESPRVSWWGALFVVTLTFPPLIAVFVIGGWAFLKHASLRVLASAVVLAPFAVTALFAAAKAAVRPQDATRYSLIVAAALPLATVLLLPHRAGGLQPGATGLVALDGGNDVAGGRAASVG